ncbi:hypothetical protein J7443_08490 [Tropicibacter sp. R15_0]|uniref:calcium-binding protein n=1 Tax=Tropicibacter sp. R15_0 TaxID=2821101 RepID=UPI001ADC0896|nr:calcium-binding protein [Tropicibacter sp. R15_0]MBO9465261.1 hypothetical protein [Tropicibacter sp. R15_0]
MADINGTNGNNILNGTSETDRIKGFAGNDTLNGNGGVDTLEGGEGNDHLILHRSASDDDTSSSSSALHGDAGNDTLEASVSGLGQVHMFGGDGDDTLILDVTNETNHQGHHAYGGEGADIFQFTNIHLANSPINGRIDDFDVSVDKIYIENNEIDLFALPTQIQLQDGSWVEVKVVSYRNPNLGSDSLGAQQFLCIGDNVFYALGGARLTGSVDGNGNYTEESHFMQVPMNLASLPAVQYIDPFDYVPEHEYDHISFDTYRSYGRTADVRAGSGDDFIYFNKRGSGDGNIAHGNDGDDVINGGQGHDTLYGGNGNDLLAGGIDNDQLYGDAGDDTVWGGSGHDELMGQDGNDLLFGNTGNDAIWGGNGADTMHGGLGYDSIGGGLGNDSINGDQGNDEVWGGSGADTVHGGTGNDTLGGGDGNDDLSGGEGNDSIGGGGGHDSVEGGWGNDTVWGYTGNDTLDGGQGHDLIGGGSGNDTINGNQGNDTLWGGHGHDVINGGLGNDTLNGWAHNDVLTGGSGADVFEFYGNFGYDQILDFTTGEDKIDLSNVAGLNSFSDVQSVVHDYGNGAYISDGQGNSFVLMGVDPSDLSADDFIF